MTETKHWFTARKGSQLAKYHHHPSGLLLGIIEVHPDHRPIMHWLGGPDEELRPDAGGVYTVYVPSPNCTITVNVGASGGYGGTGEGHGHLPIVEIKNGSS
jgi:hypothetical protein